MPGNSFGLLFKITSAGESHGKANVVIIDGCPPNIPLNEDDLQYDLDRRKPGQSSIVTQRKEQDKAIILSGVFEGKTTGTSIAIIVYNEDQRSKDYSNIKDKYRPGHADYTFDAKYGFRDFRGGGRSSARETISRVAAGVIAKKILNSYGINVLCYVSQVGKIKANISYDELSAEKIEQNIVRCPDQKAAELMIDLIKETRKNQDSIGGISEIVVTGMLPGLGEPVFDKLKADLAKGLLSIPAVTAFEYGSGFAGCIENGSKQNDIFINKNDKITTKTNNHGGMLGGISSGNDILLKVGIKPTSSLSLEQQTVDKDGNVCTLQTKGRHDPCLLPRFVPIGEAMTAIVIADHILRHKAQCSSQLEKFSNDR